MEYHVKMRDSRNKPRGKNMHLKMWCFGHADRQQTATLLLLFFLSVPFHLHYI